MSNISLKLDDDKIDKIVKTYINYIKPNPNEHIKYFISLENLTISVYNTNKVLFQGQEAIEVSKLFIEKKEILQQGSDEVGTGDYFGPVVVCAAIVEPKDYNYLNSIKICDSKQLTDDYILKIGPELIKRFKHTILILDNLKYNDIHKTNNLNAIKAKMHNKAYLNLIDKGYKLSNMSYIDEFCSKDNYFNYLKNESKIYNQLIFETKAESKYESVALASCIARYTFLKYWDQMEEKYDIKLPKGSSDPNIINIAKKFIEKHSSDKLAHIAKLHFQQTEKILNDKIK